MRGESWGGGKKKFGWENAAFLGAFRVQFKRSETAAGNGGAQEIGGGG